MFTSADHLHPLLAAAMALTAILTATGEAGAGDRCISQQARARLEACEPDLNRPSTASDQTQRPSRRPGIRRRAIDFGPKPIKKKGALTNLHRQLCAGGPDGNLADVPTRARLAFTRGKLYYQAQWWQEAAADFRYTAMSAPTTADGILAAQLYVDTLNIIGSKIPEPRAACYHRMAEDVPKLIDQYCGGTRTAPGSEPCRTFERIRRDILRLKAEGLVKRADQTAGSDRDRRVRRYERAAEKYYALWRDHYKPDCEARRPGCRHGEEVLYNAARAFRAAGLRFKAIKVMQVLVDPRYGLDGTEPAIRAIHEIGHLHQSMGMFELAALWYERFALSYPKSHEAPEALSDAVVLRLALGDTDQAVDNAARFQRLYGRSKPREAAQVAAAIGAHHVERADWSKVDRHLSRAMRLIEAHGTADLRLGASCHLARAKLALGDAAEADRLYRRVSATWSKPDRRQRLIASFDSTQPGHLRRLGKVLTAVAEAYLHFSKQQRDWADGMVRPPFRGAPTRARLQSYLTGQLVPWLAARQRAIRAAAADYQRIPRLRPAPPPGAVVEASSDVAAMWAALLEDLRGPPYRAAGAGQSADQQWYRRQVEQLAAPLQRKAKQAHRTCLAYSAEYLVRSDDRARCHDWLSRHYPAEHRPVLELMPAPTWRGAALSERWPALPASPGGTRADH
ncbi:MAG: hypothetical protein JRI68_01075 [Deltaproteobacteria bacterium]|nr:hypothetical protein [Deltaproteobacteria bacterium]